MIIKKTKAAILAEQNKPLVLDEIYLPEKLLKGQILVEMKYAGICGSQLGEIDGVKGKDKFLPHLLGHEGIAKVLQVGPGVKKVKIADKVLLHWMPSNGIDSEPPIYKWKNKNLNAGKVTTFNYHSIVSENRVTKINRFKNDLDILLLGCTASTAIGSVDKVCRIKKDSTVVVAGCGPIGLYLIKYLKFLKIKEIISIDINMKKLLLSRKYGAHQIIFNQRIRNTNPFSFINKKIDYLFDCTGNSKIISRGYESLKQDGSIILIGVPHFKNKIKINTLGINLGKKLLGSKGGNFNSSKDLKKFLKLVSLSELNSKNFIKNKIRLKQINTIFSKMRKNNLLGKSIIKFK
tara:strand:+ start:2730 stop:3773 length:1044 start_codon:yes stop_codon:yes gene_type:complete